MSLQPFAHSSDLKRLREDGYAVSIRGGLLLMRDVPYVDSTRCVRLGTLISSLNMAGDQTQAPETHVMHFDGEFPCQANGTRIDEIAHQSNPMDLGNGVTAKHSFSSRPTTGCYPDYHAKMTTYANILSGPARVLDPTADPRTYRTPEEEEDSVFNYIETASDRVGIGVLSDRLRNETIAIIGTGGTGSYVLDFVAKAPVLEVRLFDNDDFLQHNAFRSPGAASIEELRVIPKKVDYLAAIYSKMHRRIVPVPTSIDASNVDLLDGTTFAFLSMDAGEAKRAVVKKLEAIGVPFIDMGMGLEFNGRSLGGILRVTTSTPTKRDHVHDRVSFEEGDAVQNLYASNIQVADLNALNAVLAVIKWKKLRGFYRDDEHEHHCTYTIDGNLLLNNDLA